MRHCRRPCPGSAGIRHLCDAISIHVHITNHGPSSCGASAAGKSTACASLAACEPRRMNGPGSRRHKAPCSTPVWGHSLRSLCPFSTSPFVSRVLAFSHRPRTRGGWSAYRRTLWFLSRVPGATAALRSATCPVASGTLLSALHRGDFRPGPTPSSPAVGHRIRSDCPRQATRAWRSEPEPPVALVGPQPRDATPRSAFGNRLRKTPLLSEDANLVA
jgi:hypothetical protein